MLLTSLLRYLYTLRTPLALIVFANFAMRGLSAADAEKQVSKPVVKAGLSLTISLDKRIFLPGEKIELHFALKNQSERDMFISDGAMAPSYHEAGPHRCFEVKVIAEDDHDLFFWSGIATEGITAMLRRAIKLAPNEEYQGAITLCSRPNDQLRAEQCGGTFEDKTTRRAHLIGEDGHAYRVALVYQPEKLSPQIWKPPLNFSEQLLWNGSMTSTQLSFEISKE